MAHLSLGWICSHLLDPLLIQWIGPDYTMGLTFRPLWVRSCVVCSPTKVRKFPLTRGEKFVP